MKKSKGMIFYMILLLYLFYYSYRYILKYNASTTSPTYQDTPIPFQLAKYMVLACLLFLLSMLKRGRLLFRKENKAVMAASVFMIIQTLLLGTVSRNLDAISIAMLLMPCLFYLGGKASVRLQSIEKILVAFWCFSALYEAVQLLLYFRSGRLPALAYPTGMITDVRFGGAWDDPNGYALLMSFYIIYFLFRYKGVKQLFFGCASIAMLVLTWSITGMACLLATVLIILLLRHRDQFAERRFLFWICLLSVFVFLFWAMRAPALRTGLRYFLGQKQGSIEGHMAGFDASWMDAATLLGISPRYQRTEVGYLRLLSIGGIPSVLAFLTLGFSSIGRYMKMIRIIHREDTGGKRHKSMEREGRGALLYGCMAYAIAFMLSMLNLPEIVNFSCMGFFTACCILSFCLRLEPKNAYKDFCGISPAVPCGP